MFACLITMGCMSCTSEPKPVDTSRRKMRVVDSSGVTSVLYVDTIFKKDDIVRINGKIYAVN